MTPNTIILSHATYLGASGATAAATYQFMTKGYKPPTEDRAIDKDDVINQNGRFRYIYDNGPGFKQWPPFSVMCEKPFEAVVGVNTDTQYARIREMWDHRGLLGMKAPEGTYVIAWGADLERNFIVFPKLAGATQIEYEVVVQFQEATP